VQSDIVAHAAAVSGTPDVITVTFAPAFAAYAARMRFRFTAIGANSTTNPMINVDGLGAKTIKKLAGLPLAVADIGGPGHICECIYNGTDVILLNFAPLAESRANSFTAKQTFNGPVIKGTTVLADAATIAWDLSTGADFKVTITSNRILGAFINGTPGQEGILTVMQDAVGGWSLDLGNAVYDFWGPSIENVARGPNEETVYEYKVTSPSSLLLRRKGATTIGGPGRDLLDLKTANNNATIDFVLTKWLQLYDRFEIELEDVQASTNNVQFWLRTSSNGGSSYDTGASDYKWVLNRIQFLGNVTDGGASDNQIVLLVNSDTQGLSNVLGETASGKVTLHNPRLSAPCKVVWQITHIPDNTSSHLDMTSGSGLRTATADVDAVRLLLSSGNIAFGTFRLYGIRR
jgi:hypothetical protein